MTGSSARPVLLITLTITPLLAAPTNSSDFDTIVKPFVRSYCVACHNAKLSSGSVSLDQQHLKSRDIWEKAIEKVRSGEMPPPGATRPSADRVSKFTTSIEAYFEAQDRKAPPDAGRVTARRLNRYEYTNTVRDLLDVRVLVAQDFPPDPYGYGFDNVGDVLSLSPVLTEKYLKAAERIAEIAIPSNAPGKVVAARYMAEAMGQQSQLHIQTVHEFPMDGVYTLRTAWFQGYMPGFKMTGRIFLDGKEVLSRPITIYTEMDRGIEVSGLRISQGPHKIEAEIEPPQNLKGPKPYPEYIQIHGPFEQVKPSESAGYKRLFVCGHAPGQHAATCSREVLSTLMRRAYRRPLRAGELERILTLVKSAQKRGASYESAMRVGLQAVLMSPSFLFRVEHDEPGKGSHRLDDLELASRLSYFLWSSMPDDELLSVAETGRLHVPSVLHAQVRRMVSDSKSRALAESFGGQWLQTRNLDNLKPDAAKFPEYDIELRDAMRTETEMFFEAIVKEDRSILEFLDGRFTYLNERLAKLYNIPDVTGRAFRRYELDGSSRSGVLTQASVLTVSSYPTRTSPVIRGKWILENILGAAPPPPPPDVPPLDEQAIGATSFRAQLEKHRSNAACSGCHARMDPIGFGLENYDAIGRWRTMDGKFAIEPSGDLPDGRKFSGAAELKSILKADSSQFVRAISEKMLTYATGRGVEPFDRPAVARIAARVEKNGYRFSELIAAIVDSVPFQMRRRTGVPASRSQ